MGWIGRVIPPLFIAWLCLVTCVVGTTPPQDCADLFATGTRQSGIYTVGEPSPYWVYCDMSFLGGGWTVLQRRQDGSVDFAKTWGEYQQGFGDLDGEFWLGLDKIHTLTTAKNNILQIELEDFNGERRYARYGTFSVGNSSGNYVVSISGYSGDAGDSLTNSGNDGRNNINGVMFSTKDRDNDANSAHCASLFSQGGWWYPVSCSESFLNGRYNCHQTSVSCDASQGVVWVGWGGASYFLKKTTIMIRPADFTGSDPPQDCADLYEDGIIESGVNAVSDPRVFVYCDMRNSGGGWTLIQRRQDGSVDFAKNWADYEQGFGNLDGEHWLGLNKQNQITGQKTYILRVDLSDWEGQSRYATYSSFSVGDSSTDYQVSISGYSGDAGDSLTSGGSRFDINGLRFTTSDNDNDPKSGSNCAQSFGGGGWWFPDSCGYAMLNGRYNDSGSAQGVTWERWRGYTYSLKMASLKVRPNDFAVSVPPQFVQPTPAGETRKLGRALTWTCKATGDPLPIITWWHGSDKLTTTSTTQTGSGVQYTESAFTISAVSFDDNGTYSCVAGNIGGFEIATFYLTVQDCTPGEFGPGCTGTCHCASGRSVCDVTDGVCSSGGCEAGWKGSKCQTDVDECDTDTHNCHIYATCSNSEGSFNCSCNPGYHGNGTSCTEQKTVGLSLEGTIVGTVAVVIVIGAIGAVVFYCRRKNKNVPKRRDVPLKDIGDQPGTGGARNEAFEQENGVDTAISERLSSLTTVADVQTFLIDNGLQECARAFRENDVDGKALRHLDDAMMKDLVPMVGPRARLKAVLQELNGSGIQVSLESPISTLNFWEIPRSSLKLGRRLGRGQFGEVRLGEVRNRGVTTSVAVKTLRDSASDSDKKDLLGELEILVTVGRHDNIISLVGACTTDGPLMIVVEYSPNGCLKEWLKTNSVENNAESEYQNQSAYASQLSMEQLIQFGVDVASGMSHLAAMQCIHRDLAARNILLGENLVAKVSDFGLSRDIYEDSEYVKSTQSKLPLRWMAYESLFYNVYTTQSDVWSFGVLLWEIMTMGKLPYEGMKGKRMMDMIKVGGRLEKPNSCPDEIYTLMTSCWETLPEDRPTFHALRSSLIRIIQGYKTYASLLK
ncbi:fibroblast growth factor receptor 1-like [Branchiostoma lanceolatum]|uniref:fibroblast growth factor receptor 1-like n=1 Tax=Branchiostoma lanceolatum TaxID=7740 RepID=UPI003455988A